jgi:hypothetical protein
MVEDGVPIGQGLVGHLPGDEVRVEVGFFRHAMNLKEVFAAFEHEGDHEPFEATLRVLEEVREPGEVVELPFQWLERPGQVHADPVEPPPIAKRLARRPWLVANFLSEDIPEPRDLAN